MKFLKMCIRDRVNVGDIFNCAYSIKDGKTQPPNRYTSGSITLAMENAGNLIEDESLREQIKGSGIGTSSTRAETIEKLIRLKHINIDDKTQVLTPAKMGLLIYDVVKEELPTMLSPKMTASWEKGLEEIENGTISKQQYIINKQSHFCRSKHLCFIVNIDMFRCV